MHRFSGLTVAVAFVLVVGACGGNDAGADTTTTSAQQATTTMPPATTAAPTTTVAPTTTQAATTTAAPTTTEPPFEPPPTLTLDDPILAVEPPDTAYRAQLTFTMRAVLADGTVQEGIVIGDGGKLLEPSESHSFVVAANEFADIPNCFNIATASPAWVSAYHTFYGGLSGEEGGDLMGDAMLAETGIMNNGVLVDRYEITLDNIDPEDADEYTTFDIAYIDIAREGGHVVSLVLNGLGFNNSFLVDQSEPREIVYELNFSEFDEITEFTVPEDCEP